MIWAIVGVIILLYFAIRMIDNRHKVDEDVIEAVPTGNVSIFMDHSGHIHVIPFSLNKYRQGRASDYPLYLTYPYTPSQVGEVVRQGLIRSNRQQSLTNVQLMGSLGINDWRAYSQGKRSVSVTSQQQEVVIHSTVRRSDGAYLFRGNGFEKALPHQLTNEAFGSAILEMLKKSR